MQCFRFIWHRNYRGMLYGCKLKRRLRQKRSSRTSHVFASQGRTSNSWTFMCLQFHQTIKTYLFHRVWQFHFYVSKNWPDEEICLHFPGCTLTPHHNIYESFGFFCPLDSLEYIELIKSEDVLIDWSTPKYLNYTECSLVDGLEDFLTTMGKVERIQGEVYVLKASPDCLDLGELQSSEVVSDFRGFCRLNEKYFKQFTGIATVARGRRKGNPRFVSGKWDWEHRSIWEAGSNHSRWVRNASQWHFFKFWISGYGIFTVDGELAAWMVQSYYGAMFSMQTKPEHRRKGWEISHNTRTTANFISNSFSYGIYLAQNLSRLVIKRGYKPFVVIRHENEASKSLYKKLGFEKEFEMARIVFTPFDYIDGEKNGDDKEQKNGSTENGNHVNGKSSQNGVSHEHEV